MINRTYFSLTDDLLFERILDTHNLNSGCLSPSTGLNLSYLIRSVPLFSPFMLYEGANYKSDYKLVSAYLSRLSKRGEIMPFKITNSCEDFYKLYYITKKGYEKVSSIIPSNVAYKSRPGYASKAGKRMQNTALHDYGIGFSYLAFLLSPFTFNVNYEFQIKRNPGFLSDNKASLKSLRPDLLISAEYKDTPFNVYIEQDTGSESIPVLINKLLSYSSYSLLNPAFLNDALIFSFRTSNPKKPDCFMPKKLSNLISLMDNNDTLYDLIQDDILPPSLTGVSNALISLFPSKAYTLSKNDLQSLLKGVLARTGPSLYAYYKRHQYEFFKIRRNGIINSLKKAALNPPFGYIKLISYLLSGFKVYLTPTVDLIYDLPLFFPALYSDIKKGIFDTVKISYPFAKPFGELTISVGAPHLPGIKFSDSFYVTGTERHIVTGYISRDLSVFIRLYVLSAYKDALNINLTMILFTDNIKDAMYFSLMLPDKNVITKDDTKKLNVLFCDLNSDNTYIVKEDMVKYV